MCTATDNDAVSAMGNNRTNSAQYLLAAIYTAVPHQIGSDKKLTRCLGMSEVILALIAHQILVAENNLKLTWK